MILLKWFYTEIGTGNPPPQLVYYALRGGMFLLSFVLEDWAVYELVPSPRHRRATVVLVASSYVTWTYQTHTFSNSLETLLVAWGLVLIRRIVENKVRPAAWGDGVSTDLGLQRRSSFFSYAVLSFITVVGVFNRVTFPAFLLFPGLQLLPYFQRKWVSVPSSVNVSHTHLLLLDQQPWQPSSASACSSPQSPSTSTRSSTNPQPRSSRSSATQ